MNSRTGLAARAGRRVIAGLGLIMAVASCSTTEDPQIVNVTVEPSSWKISGLADTATFTITADIVHFSDSIKSVTASVQGQPSLSYDLSKQETIANGERWQVATNLTLWKSISSGTYNIDVTATDTGGDTQTKKSAATVKVTD